MPTLPTKARESGRTLFATAWQAVRLASIMTPGLSQSWNPRIAASKEKPEATVHQ
jgi:hypothetical protein